MRFSNWSFSLSFSLSLSLFLFSFLHLPPHSLCMLRRIDGTFHTPVYHDLYVGDLTELFWNAEEPFFFGLQKGGEVRIDLELDPPIEEGSGLHIALVTTDQRRDIDVCSFFSLSLSLALSLFLSLSHALHFRFFVLLEYFSVLFDPSPFSPSLSLSLPPHPHAYTYTISRIHLKISFDTYQVISGSLSLVVVSSRPSLILTLLHISTQL